MKVILLKYCCASVRVYKYYITRSRCTYRIYRRFSFLQTSAAVNYDPDAAAMDFTRLAIESHMLMIWVRLRKHETFEILCIL